MGFSWAKALTSKALTAGASIPAGTFDPAVIGVALPILGETNLAIALELDDIIFLSFNGLGERVAWPKYRGPFGCPRGSCWATELPKQQPRVPDEWATRWVRELQPKWSGRTCRRLTKRSSS